MTVTNVYLNNGRRRDRRFVCKHVKLSVVARPNMLIDADEIFIRCTCRIVRVTPVVSIWRSNAEITRETRRRVAQSLRRDYGIQNLAERGLVLL